MTYRELCEITTKQLEHNEITLGEYDEMTKPLDRQIGTCKDCKYVSQNDDNDRYCGLSGGYYDPNYYCVDFEKRGNENGSN